VSTTTADGGGDQELLDAVAAGDRHALRALYERHAPWLVLRLTRRCSDPAAVDQAVQDTFLAVWRKPGTYRGDGAVAAWIWGIGVRRLIDQMRRRPAMTWIISQDEAQVSAEDQVLLGVEHGDLAGVLDGLSPELRAVVQATVLDGLTSREAGRLLGIPAGTVKTRMSRARTQMREALA
jgi:RNA polymerase sigma-70 factor (ECF subfamily)